MKLKKLVIRNIASIEDAVIDFSEYPLANQDLFLICGPTGSGKSTLLDAICIALFDTTPRIENSQKGQIDEFDSSLVISNVKDVLNLVRKNAVEASISLTFDDKDGIERIAEWRVYRLGQYRGGKEVSTFSSASLEKKLSYKLKKEWTLTDTKGDVITKNVASEIQAAIGMNFDQFCKTTMLAQGEFTKFLSSDPESKAEILEKMVGTEIYGQVGQKINERSNALTQQVKMLQNVLDTMQENALPADKKEACQNRLVEIGKQQQVLENQIDELTKKLKWLEESRKIDEDILIAQKEKESAERNAQSEQTKQAQTTVALWDRTIDVRNEIKRKQELEAQIENLLAQKDCLKDDYLKAAAGLSDLITKSDILKEKNRILEEKLRGLTPFDTMFSKANVIVQCHNDVVKNETFIAENRPKIDDFNKEIQQLLEKKSQNDDKLTSANESILENDNASKQLDDQLSELGADTIDKEVNQLNANKLNVSETKNALENWKNLKHDCSEKNKSLEQAKSALEQKLKEKDAQNAAVEQASKTLKESELLYNQTKASVGDYAKSLRVELKVGDTCPVCGNKVIQVLADEHFETILKPIREKFEQDKKSWEDCVRAYDTLSSEIEVGNTNIDQKNNELSQLKNKEQELFSILQNRCNNLNVQQDEHLEEVLEQLMNENKTAEEKIAERQQSIAEIRRKKTEIANKSDEVRQKQIGPITKENEQIQTQVAQLQQNLSELNGRIATCQNQVENSENEIKNLINPAWKPEHENCYFEELQSAAQQYAEDKKTLESNKNLHAQMKREIEQSEDCRSVVLQQFVEWKEGSVVASPIQDLSRCWIELQSKTYRVAEGLKETTEQKRNAEQTIQQFFQEHVEITTDAVKSVLTMTTFDVETKRKDLENLRVAIETAKAKLEAATKRQRELPANPLAEGETAEILQEKINSCNQQKDSILIEQGDINRTLQTDQETQQIYSEKEAEKRRVEDEAKEWKMLDDYLGSTGGKRFRNIAQSFILGELLDKANVYLENITGRYTLFCNPGTLTILMRDAFQGGVVRPTNTLSGGESFIISLSLALGLSSMQSAGLEVDTLFIDEGFGTLSPEYLDPVISALKRLYEQYGRRVGIISHVDTLKARIPVTIEVSQEGNSSSKVEVVAI